MSERTEPELHVKIRFHDTESPENEPVALRVHKDGSVEIEGGAETGHTPERLEPGSRAQCRAWSVAVEKTDEPWAGPELLVLPSEDSPGGRMRCPLPETVGTSVLIGRSRRACDITVHDDHVSRVHLKLTLTENGFSVEDMESKWGTQFNGRPLHERTLLGHGDELRIGTTVVRFLTRWDAAASRSPRPADTGDPDLFETAETQTSPLPGSSFGLSRSPSAEATQSPGHSGQSGTPQRQTPSLRPAVPPLWIGMGIGLMIALVGIMVWTLVTMFWPGG
jgi:pSer/pThr/pTyr-binding forkhead associated (FHA) protein